MVNDDPMSPASSEIAIVVMSFKKSVCFIWVQYIIAAFV
jgi:hypothetical protein